MSSSNENKRKEERRWRRKRHVRKKVFGTPAKPRLTVFRSHKNISCQLIDDSRGVTLAAASTLQSELKVEVEKRGGNCKAAAAIGKSIGEKALALGLRSVQFDRNGYRYHGRLKALVEAARAAGLKL